MNLNTINTNNKNFWDETKEFVILNNRFPLNPPEQCPGFYSDLTDKVVERLKHSLNLFDDLGRIKFDLANTSVPLDNTYVTALQQWHIELTATGVLVFEAQDVMGEYVKQFKTRRRSWINTLKQTVKDYAEKNMLNSWVFVWHISDQLELFSLDFWLRDEVYAPHYSSAAPWRIYSAEYCKDLLPKGAGELPVAVQLNAKKERQSFSREMVAFNCTIDNSRNLLSKVNMKTGDRQCVFYRKHLYDKQAFESMCECAGNNYYVLYDGMETVLFKFETLVSFSLNESQRSSLAQVGICIAEDGSFVDAAGNTCNIYLPYIFASRYGSYRESPSALSHFRMWQNNGLELEPLRAFVHKFWNYPTDGVYAFDSIDEFLCYYVGEAPGGNYGERVAGYTTTNEDPQVPYYLSSKELTLDTTTARYMGSISVPDGEYSYKSIWSMRSGETFMIINRNGEQFVYPLFGESYRKFVRECFYYEEEYCPWEFRENTTLYYDSGAVEIGRCCYQTELQTRWVDIAFYDMQIPNEDFVENETLYRNYHTGAFFIRGKGLARDEYYAFTDLCTPTLNECSTIPITNNEAAAWINKYCGKEKLREVFGDIDPS